MKTKKLIELLQSTDPEGENECCVNNIDIISVDIEPAYWDGPLQVLIHDKSKEPYFDVVGGKITKKGTKINICTLPISDLVWGNENFPLEFDNDENLDREKGEYEKIRIEGKNIRKQISDSFIVKVLEKYKQGLIAFQNHYTDEQRCNIQLWMNDKNEFVGKLCQGECQAIIQSGFFKKKFTELGIVWNLSIGD